MKPTLSKEHAIELLKAFEVFEEDGGQIPMHYFSPVATRC